MEYNLLIVEDDEIQRRNLKLMLQELEVEVNIFEAANLKDAMLILNQNNIDLFYLDHNLPDSSGIELGKRIREIDKYKLTWIIFLTSHVEYMLEAFKQIHCYDYILKPYTKEEIEKLTLELINGFRKNEAACSININPYIEFKVDGIKLKLFTDQIYFIEVNLRTCYIHTKCGIYKVEKISLGNLAEKLPKDTFIQSHRAYLVNMNYISKLFQYKGAWVLSFKDYDQTALIGRTFKEKLLDSIEYKNITISGI